MNDASVKAIWDVLRDIQHRLERVEFNLATVEGRIRARLKEEAGSRKLGDIGVWIDND